MYVKPQFKPHFHIEVVEPTTVYLLSEQGNYALSGRLYTLLAPLLNGRYTVDDIVEQLKEQTSLFSVYYALTHLESQGYLNDADHPLPPEVAAFWSSQGIEPRTAASKLQGASVGVTALGKVKKEPLIVALTSLNIKVSDEGDLNVVLTDDYLQLELERFNQKALQRSNPWLLVKPVGIEIWVGPIFVPGQTGCWECLSHRLRANREVATSVQQQLGITSPFPTARSILPTHFQVGLNLAASEVAKWLVQGQHNHLKGQLLTLDLAALSMQYHRLVKRPQCPTCGHSTAIEYQKPQPIVLNSQKKQFTKDGGHRSFSPEQTLQKYEHLISPITGVVSALPKLESGNELIHIYSAIHPFGGKLDSLANLRQSLRHKSAGKGKTDLQSRASGLGEAIERYSGIFTGDEIRIKDTYAQLESVAIHPNTCMQFSAKQYQNRAAWNQKHSSSSWIPDPFDEEREVEWTPVWSLTCQQFKYLPTAFCYYNYPLPDDYRFCGSDYNGNAAGNTLEEAILQGFMELVERDSVALWWYNRLQRPTVDLDSFDDPYLQALHDYYQKQHRDLWVLDITSDLNIPTLAAISRRTDRTAEKIMLGFGTHFDPKIALLRAVTEMNQSWRIDLENGQNLPDASDWQSWLKEATLENQPYLASDKNESVKTATDYPQSWSDDLKQDVLTCIEIVAQQGLETLILDQTHLDIGMSVVKVIVPGLRHFWPRFAPGRLYDVPVKMGWLPAPLNEEQLNPIPIFF